jgi:uncharacterized protein YqeY
MALLAKLQLDAKAALKSGDEARVSVLRMMLAELHNREIAGRSGGNASLTDTEVEAVLRKEVKRRNESKTLFLQGKRNDLAEQAQKEIVIIQGYLSPTIDATAIEAIVDEVLRGGASDFAAVMREAMQRLKGKADGVVVSEIVKRKLSEHGSG